MVVVRLSTKEPIAGVLWGKAITRALWVLRMLKPGSGFRDVFVLPGLRGTGLSVTIFPGVMVFARSSALPVFWVSRQILDAGLSSGGREYCW